jgi:peptide/nickel transport system substrate-binding protein
MTGIRYARTTPHTIVRGLVRLLVVVVLLSAALPVNAMSAEAAPRRGQTCRRLADFDVCGRFLEVWSQQGSDQGSVYVNGFPITALRPEISVVDGKTYGTQWFERARYEAHPENKAPYDVLLGRLGANFVEGRGSKDPYTNKLRDAGDQPFAGVDKPADAEAARLYFPETRHTVSGKILEYWNKYGGLQQFGFPLSEPFDEISAADGKTYTVQYFERNRFEYHPEKRAPYEVELGLLGVQQYKQTSVPGDRLPISPPKGVKSSKDTLIIGALVEPENLHPWNSTAINENIIWPLYEQVVDYDAKGSFIPRLVWYVPTIENGGARFVGTGENRHLEIRFKLRQGMKWSDGVEITSNDAVFAYRYEMDPEAASFKEMWQQIANFDNPDKYTVIAKYLSYAQARDLYNSGDKEQFARLRNFIDRKLPIVEMAFLLLVEVLPEHILGEVPISKQTELGYWGGPDADPSLLVTSGPWKVDRWDKGQQLVLVPNPYYSVTGPPLLKKIVFRFVPDRDKLIAQAAAGDVDLLLNSVITLPTDEALKTLAAAGLTIDSADGPAIEFLEFNLDTAYFKEKVVRQAMAYSINRRKIVEAVSGGRWKVPNTFVPPVLWSSMDNPDFPGDLREKYPLHLYNYEPAKANQMLDAAGWSRGSDGIRTKGGLRLSFRYDTSNASLRQQVQALVAADLKVVGIEAKVSSLPQRAWLNALNTRDYELGEVAWITNPGGEAGPGGYHSADIPTPENNFQGANVTGYRNPRADELTDTAHSFLEREKVYPPMAELQSIISEDLPDIPLFTRSSIQVYNPKLMNWTNFFYARPLWNSQTLYFK